MRVSVREAMQASAARTRQVKREELAKGKGGDAAGASPSSKSRGKACARKESGSEDGDGRMASRERLKAAEPRDFEKVDTSAPKRLNDVAEAPPELKKLPRKAKKLAAIGGAAKGSGAKYRSITLACGAPRSGTYSHPAEACDQLAAVHGDIGQIKPAHGACDLVYQPVVLNAVGDWQGQPRSYHRQFANQCIGVRATGGFLFSF